MDNRGGEPAATAPTRRGGQVRFFEEFDPDFRAACVRLWMTEVGPRRRYLEIADTWQLTLVDFFAAGVDDPDALVRCQLVTAAMTGVPRAELDAAISLHIKQARTDGLGRFVH